MGKKLILSLIAGLVCNLTFGQAWLEDRTTTNQDQSAVSFYDLRDGFNSWFETHDQGKGTGYKQFLRYRAFMEPRVYPSGIFPQEALWNASVKKESSRLKSATTAAAWVPLGPFSAPSGLFGGLPVGVGRINCIAFHPTDQNIFYVGSPSGGVWKTINGGTSWTTTTDQLPAMGISDIAINPKNPQILYIVTGDKDGGNTCPTYSFGILKSTDAGVTWNPTGLVQETTAQIRMRRILVNPVNPDIVITAGEAGIYRSVNGGQNWTRVMTNNFFDLEFKPDDPMVLYACTGNSIFKSPDGGITFSQLSGGLPASGIGRTEMAVTKANANVIYAVMSNSGSGFKGLYKSSDTGASWTAQSTEDVINIFSYAADGTGDTGIAWYAIALTIDQSDENIVYSGSVNHWCSVNGGRDWTIAAHWYGANGKPYVHADVHTLVVNPLNNICYSGNDGGIYKTTDKGLSWTDVSANLSILQIYRMGASYSNSAFILEGSQDNGTYLYNNGQWNSVYGGDGMECAIDPVNPSIMYASSQNGAIGKSTNGGRDWTSIKPEAEGNWITPFQISSLNHNMLVTGYKSVYLTTTYGNNWKKISGDLTGGGKFNEITFAPSDERYIYTSSESSIWGTRNMGETWTKLNNGLPNLYIEGILVAPSEPEKVWVALSGYTAGSKVFYSDDGGSSWTNYSDGLPNVPVNCLTINKMSEYALYAGTDLGVYYRNPSMNEWVPFDNGLPNVIVNELDINYRINKIRAATFGRGIWESPIRDDGNWPPALQLSASEQPTQIALSWIAPTERVPGHYAIYRDSLLLTTSATNSFTDQVTTGMTYAYRVSAVYPDGESTLSNTVTARGTVNVTIPYNQDFTTLAHGWLISGTATGWTWGTGATLGMNPLGTGNFIGINSVTASKVGKNARGYALLPKMDLSGQTNLVLTCKYSLRQWQNLDHLYLTCRIAGEPVWTTLKEVPVSGKVWSWKTFTYSIPDSLMTDELEFAFYYTDSNGIGYGAALDDVTITREASGIENPVTLQDVTVYPNPASESFSIAFKGFSGQKVQVEIVDINGHLMLKKEMETVVSGKPEVFSVRSFAPGNYIVRLTSGTQTWIRPVTKN